MTTAGRQALAWMAVLGLAVAGFAGCVAEGEGDGAAVDESAGDDELFGSSSECPTVSEDRSLSLFWWKTTRYPVRFVWSPGGGDKLLGAEVMYEEKKSWNPLSGTTDKRKMCHRLYWIGLDGKGRQDLTKVAKEQTGELYAYPQKGYVIVQVLKDGSSEYQRVGLDGSRKTLATFGGNCTWGRVVPSPDGSRLAIVRRVQTGCDAEPQDGQTPVTATTATVQFADAAGVVQPGQVTVKFDHFVYETWMPSGELVLSDLEVAKEVGFDLSVKDVALPGCVVPPTSSSEVDASGRTVGVSEKELPEIVATEPDAAYGCQKR